MPNWIPAQRARWLGTTVVPRPWRSFLSLDSSPGLTAGTRFCRPFGPGRPSERSRTFRAVTELERAKGPGDNSHARKGVVRIADKVEGRRPSTQLARRHRFFTARQERVYRKKTAPRKPLLAGAVQSHEEDVVRSARSEWLDRLRQLLPDRPRCEGSEPAHGSVRRIRAPLLPARCAIPRRPGARS